MDNEYRLDFPEILKTVRTAEVILFRFVTVPQRMLLDYRHNEIDGPMIKLVPRATSPEDRFKSVKMLRPRFRVPPKISAVWWPRHVERLVEDGVWPAIVQRIVDGGYPAIAAEAEAVLDELRRMERDELANAIGGDGYRTLWPVTSS